MHIRHCVCFDHGRLISYFSFGVETYAIGIGSRVDSHELRDIATDTKHVFQVGRFDDLDSIHEQVVKNICASKYM